MKFEIKAEIELRLNQKQLDLIADLVAKKVKKFDKKKSKP